MKKRGKESLSDDEVQQAKEDFFYACDCTAEMLEEFSELGLYTAPALGGALTQIISHLIVVSPDTKAAMSLLSTCINNATINLDEEHSTHETSYEVH